MKNCMTFAMFNKSCFFTSSSAVLFTRGTCLGIGTGLSETLRILSSSSTSSVGVVPGDPHPGDPRGKYFSGSPFPGEFFHGDPGEN